MLTSFLPGKPRRTRTRTATRRRPLPLGLEALELRLTPSLTATGYPVTGGTPLQRVAFSESEVLRYFQVGNTPGVGTTLQVYYNDEHALALGVSSVTVNGVTTSYASNTSTYPGTPPSGGLSPVKTGAPYYTPAQLGDNAATVTALNLAIHEGTKAPAGAPGSSDGSGRPLFPVLFVTDITNNSSSTSGDWQQGGTPVSPTAVFGSWKYFTESITSTAVTLTGASDPAKNDWALGTGSDTPAVGFAALKNEGYGAEIRWNISALGLLPGHRYRFYVVDHDGDQNKTGGDAGQAAYNFGNPLLTTTPNNVDVRSGQALKDTAHLVGSVAPTTNNATITFKLLDPSNAVVDTETVSAKINAAGNEDGDYTTPTGFVPSVTGQAATYHWIVSYSGDDSNAPFGPTSPGDEPAIAEDANITITPNSANNVVGAPHTFTVTVTQNTGSGFVAAANAPVTVTLTASNGATASPAGPFSGATDGNGQFQVTVTSATAGQIVAKASTDFFLNGVEMKRATGDANVGDSGNATKFFEDEYITITPTSANNVVGAPHVFTATVFLNTGDGTGFHPFAGTNATITLTAFNGAALTPAGPFSGTTNANGQFSATFTSASAGEVVGQASTTLTLPGGGSITRTSGDGYGSDSANANKFFEDEYITIAPASATNQVNQNHTFTATVFLNSGDGTGFHAFPSTSVTVTLTPENGATPSPAGPFTGNTDSNGKFQVTVSSSTPGDVIANASTSLTFNGSTITRTTGDSYVPPNNGGVGDSGNATKFWEQLSTQDNLPSVKVGSNSVSDTATLAGANNPGGSITFTLTAPSALWGTNGIPVNGVVYTNTVPVSGNGSYSSGSFTPVVAGNFYQWQASYSGDGTNPAIAQESNHASAAERVTVTQAPVVINTNPGLPVVINIGVKMNDSATLSGAFNPRGTITFYLFAPGVTPNATDSNAVYSDVVTLTGAPGPITVSTTNMGNHPGGYVPTVAGNYQWIALYSGDVNNAGAGSNADLGKEPELGIPPCTLEYPITNGTPLERVSFNESEVLRYLQFDPVNGQIEVFYNDEHALALGVSSVTVNGVTTSYASNTSAYPGTPPSGGLSPVKAGAPYYTPAQLGDNPATVTPLQLAIHQGTKAPAGAPGSSDASGRPLFPAGFVTDITFDQNADSGDWQHGGVPIAPSTVFGSWKYFTEAITSTSVTLTGASDPAKNNWSLGAGSDTPAVGFAALKNEGYGAEMRWNISDLRVLVNGQLQPLIPGHSYEFYVIDHDGDQNKTGGDAGQACFRFTVPVTQSMSSMSLLGGTSLGILGSSSSINGAASLGTALKRTSSLVNPSALPGATAAAMSPRTSASTATPLVLNPAVKPSSSQGALSIAAIDQLFSMAGDALNSGWYDLLHG